MLGQVSLGGCPASGVLALQQALCWQSRPHARHIADALAQASAASDCCAGEDRPGRRPCVTCGAYASPQSHRAQHQPRRQQRARTLTGPRCASSSSSLPAPPCPGDGAQPRSLGQASQRQGVASTSGRPNANDKGAQATTRRETSHKTRAAAGAFQTASVLFTSRTRLDNMADNTARIASLHASEALETINDNVAAGNLIGALSCMQALASGQRQCVLDRVSHAPFLRLAKRRAEEGSGRISVMQTLQFLALLGPAAADAKLCTLAVNVCISAADPAACLEVMRIISGQCTNPDPEMRASFVTACAAMGDLERAVAMHTEYTSAPRAHWEGQASHVALLNAFTNAMRQRPLGDRRASLVLLQRAVKVVDDIRAAGAEVSSEVLQALAAAAGRAGQVQQALQICQELQAKGKVDARVFTILVHALVAADKRELALKTYARAKKYGISGNVRLFTAAISACATPSQYADVDTAMEIYQDMLRAGIKPDHRAFAVLIRVAGLGGRMDVVLQLQDAMVSVGVPPSRATQSALVSACVANGELDHALALVTDRQLSWRALPLQAGYNALVAGLARLARLDDIVTVLGSMHQAGLRPDAYTFTAVLAACQRLSAYGLAISVYRLMRRQGVAVDEAVCFEALRACFNALREHWTPSGYPPAFPDQQVHRGGVTDATAHALFSALDPTGAHSPSMQATELHAQDAEQGGPQAYWTSLALGVYRDALGAGMQPRLHVLERLVSCLRLPLDPEDKYALNLTDALGQQQGQKSATMPDVKGFGGPLAGLPAEAIDLPSPFDTRAIAVVQGAISQGILVPPTATNLDMRNMPPNLAQAYLFTALTAVDSARVANRNAYKPAGLSILVPAFNWYDICIPSYGNQGYTQEFGPFTSEDAEDYWSQDRSPKDFFAQPPAPKPSMLEEDLSGNSDDVTAGEDHDRLALYQDAWAASQDEEDGAAANLRNLPAHCPLDDRVGLGVAGMLRRIGLDAIIQANEGKIVVTSQALVNWLRECSRSSSQAAASALWQSVRKGGMGTAMTEQQRFIRLGV
ncbi:hypothetical protein WJX73_003687 [Symbiochloris irregularis]|uniref:PROP1-like PPR domain-containing protein n=1 Tax=Symbiochloris irregularis TaxID=706552 RepID=A0AAW1PK32_9CHLO